MGYYRGDYYRGDGGNYYRGDPFLGGIIRGAVKLASPLVKKAAGWVKKQVTGSPKATAATIAAAPVMAGGSLPPILRDVVLPTLGGAAAGTAVGAATNWFTGGGAKKYRRMNVLNPRALKRALRRAEGFEKFARRTVNALRSGPKKFKNQSRKRS